MTGLFQNINSYGNRRGSVKPVLLPNFPIGQGGLIVKREKDNMK